MREVSEELRAFGVEVYVILDANATPARSINARLDRHDCTGRQQSFCSSSQPRGFVHFDTKPVPEPVTEFLTVPTALNVVTRERVRLSPLLTHPNVPGCQLVRLAHDVVDGPLLISWFPNYDGPCDIGAVTAGRGAEIDEKKLIPSDLSRG